MFPKIEQNGTFQKTIRYSYITDRINEVTEKFGDIHQRNTVFKISASRRS